MGTFESSSPGRFDKISAQQLIGALHKSKHSPEILNPFQQVGPKDRYYAHLDIGKHVRLLLEKKTGAFSWYI